MVEILGLKISLASNFSIILSFAGVLKPTLKGKNCKKKQLTQIEMQ